MGFNIGVDDDDKTGPGPNGSGARSQDLELQYFWANRARLKGWNAEEADWYTEQELADKIYEDHFDRVIDAAGRLAHGGTVKLSLQPQVVTMGEATTAVAMMVAEIK